MSLTKMNTLNEVYKAHPLTLDDIIPIDFSSSPSLPDSHTWSQPIDDDDDDDFSWNDPASSSIPIIDMMDPNAKKLIALACENWGAFHLKNHGIPLDVSQGAEQQLQRLFSLPTQQKMKALRSPTSATGYGVARISPFFSKCMWHEGFTIIGSPSHDAKKLWPHDYQQFCDTMEKYEKQMRRIADRLTEMMLEVLEISEEKRNWVGGSDVSAALQLNFYPCCPEPNRAMGLGPHTDTSIFTILQAKSSGLQLLKEGKWIPVHPHPNTLIVHTGDFLRIMSNARFCSPIHRVVPNENDERYSMAYFYSPPTDYTVSPSVTGDLNSVARFRDVTVMEYIGIKAEKFGDSLSFIST
ncbi:gibberellin 3-beta-dioxygenase 1-like [Vigna radiata var. radiata]|uniref:gibberellin 3beta-dioxygenase n=1 Tax=Vigna radiata var. radiata TaxID=3916 RepID=A0A1S3U497_VIGRR|nr:gibberellin 3-beta-dioxygenase 1-like [Vigna radiata var. radiata]